MLQFDTIEKFEYIVNNLTPEYYDRMQPYVEENYQRARPYWEKSVYQRIEDEIQKYLF